MGSRNPVFEKMDSIPPFWRLVISLLVAGSLLGVWFFAFVHNWLASAEDLPVALHSPLSADYSADAIAMIPAARINLLGDALSDQVREGNNAPAEQLATMIDQMRTPVFTATPFPGQTVTPRGLPTQANTQGLPTQTQAAPSQTMPAPTASATVLTPSATPSATLGYPATVTPDFFYPTTLVPSTATLQPFAPTRTSVPTATPTKTPRPTNPPVFASPTPTRVPPTQTPQPPTATLPPAPPTNTPVPPTNTPAPTNTPVTPDPYPPPPATDYP